MTVFVSSMIRIAKYNFGDSLILGIISKIEYHIMLLLFYFCHYDDNINLMNDSHCKILFYNFTCLGHYIKVDYVS